MKFRVSSLLVLLVMPVSAYATPIHIQLSSEPSLGTADAFSVLAGQTVTNAGPTTMNGNLGVSPGSAVTGFPPGSSSLRARYT
jgi:hypothetical protein